ncbi:MAG: hypothetical protein IJL76_03035 [Bacilli bacterium]|nr:hypothetical protein [Bacilli bacterium]
MKKINMKRLLIVVIGISILLIVLIGGFAKLINYYRVKNAKVYIVLSDTLKTEVYSDVHIGDFIEEINGDIIDDKKIDTTRLGKQKIEFSYINEDNVKVPYSYTLDVVDETKPIISTYSKVEAYVGESEFYKDIFCGDNFDSHPKCYIDGDYDINKAGEYEVKFKGEDTSGNVSTQKITLTVKEKPKPVKEKKSKKKKEKVKVESNDFKDIVKKYKKDDTKVGIDVSKWQGDINYKKVKKAGVEFVIIKVGGQVEKEGSPILDPKFKDNIKGFNKVNIPVGVYFYSHATTKLEAARQAKWVAKKIRKYDVDLPVAFDWENWDKYQSYNLSFHKLNSIADEFMTTIKNEGYKPMLYGSKSYLETIWDTEKKNVWLAHYTKETDYSDSYMLWQRCENGKVKGIKTLVDIDILYK